MGGCRRVEGVRIQVLYPKCRGNGQESAYGQNNGWQGLDERGEAAGAPGKNLRREAVQIKLTDHMAAKYDIYYRVHVQTYGWLGWAKNGESAGTSGYGKRIEGVQIRLVAKGGAVPGSTSGAFKDRTKIPNVVYQAHMQTYGWNTAVFNGETGGISGQ